MSLIQAYDKSLELNPNDAIFWFSKGNALKAQGRATNLSTPVKIYQIESKMYPDAWLNNYLLLYHPGKYNESNENIR